LGCFGGQRHAGCSDASTCGNQHFHLESWTSTNGASGITWVNLGTGNPGGYAEFTDITSSGMSAIAPSVFLGDLSAHNGETISFDGKNVSGETVNDPAYGKITIFNTAGQSYSADFATTGPVQGSWTHYTAPFSNATFT
jgi:hypothetical protein